MLARSAFLAFSPEPNAQVPPHDKEIMEIRQRLEFLTGELTRLALIVGAPPNEGPPVIQGQQNYLQAGVGNSVNT